jgi:hypothetical protein
MRRRALEQIEQRDQKQADDDPQDEVLAEVVHVKSLSGRPRPISTDDA